MDRSLCMLIVSTLVLAPSFTAAQVVVDDLTVTFTLCTEGAAMEGAFCVTGNNDPLTNWESGVPLERVGERLWRATVVLPKGTAAQLRYKYRGNGCKEWEGGADRVVSLPTDGTSRLELPPDSFDRISPIGCGLSVPLERDVVVCLQLCMSGVDTRGGVCVIGNIAELGGWDLGIPLEKIGDELLQTCIVFRKGTVVPLDVQFKFQKDECRTWETIGDDPFLNRILVVDAESPPARTLTFSWNDGRGICDAVPLTEESWGTLKSRYDR